MAAINGLNVASIETKNFVKVFKCLPTVLIITHKAYIINKAIYLNLSPYRTVLDLPYLTVFDLPNPTLHNIPY